MQIWHFIRIYPLYWLQRRNVNRTDVLFFLLKILERRYFCGVGQGRRLLHDTETAIPPYKGGEFDLPALKEFLMNDKVLIIAIFSLLGIGILSVLFIAIPWLVNYALPNWRDSLLDSGIVMIAIGLFVYGFYMNTSLRKYWPDIIQTGRGA